MTNSHSPSSADIVEQIARTLALSYGRDPDALTEWTEMCDADNRPVPIWKVYEEQAEAVVSKHLTGDVAQGASLRQALIEVTKCETALRMGGPAPEDLEGLSIALEKAVEIAANALDAAQPQVAPVDVLPTQHRDASKWPSKADIEAAHNGSSAGNVHLDELPDELNPPAIDQLFARDDLYTARAVFARLRNFGYAVTRNEPQAAQELRLAASRLTDIITMLDAPDAYNREYIAAVCRSVLSSLTRPHGA